MSYALTVALVLLCMIVIPAIGKVVIDEEAWEENRYGASGARTALSLLVAVGIVASGISITWALHESIVKPCQVVVEKVP